MELGMLTDCRVCHRDH